jgi:hypothetical protein
MVMGGSGMSQRPKIRKSMVRLVSIYLLQSRPAAGRDRRADGVIHHGQVVVSVNQRKCRGNPPT